jgi:hypothetical protein
MLLIIWPLLVAVVGILIYALASNAKVSEIGKWMFIIGLFWVVYLLCGKAFKL